MRERWIKYRGWLIVAAAVLFLGAVLLYLHQQQKESAVHVQKNDQLFSASSEDQHKADSKKSAAPEEELVVDLKGAVQKPGIYHMRPADRVIDVIEQAGGFKEQADKNKINLAQKLSDAMVVYVPEKGETTGQAAAANAAPHAADQQENSETVNVNTADEQALQNLPGIGPAKAQAIIQYREEHGPFKRVEELTDVSGIGAKSLEKMKANIVLQ